MRIKKGDTVEIITGKDEGKRGKVEKIFVKKGRVIVEGANLKHKHVKARSPRQKGGIVEVASSIDVSNVALVCPKCGLRTRVGYGVKGKEKHRICKKCGGVIR